MEINIHDSPCGRILLIVVRVLFFLALATREYFHLKDDKTLFDNAFLYLTNFGFTLTLLFYANCMWDILFNELCCKLIPKLPLFDLGSETSYQYSSRWPFAWRCPSRSSTGLLSTPRRKRKPSRV